MRVLIVSDLHFEFHRDDGKSLTASLPDADVLVCAGDLSSSKGLGNAVKTLCGRYKDVVFVAGNHEFYGGRIPVVRSHLTRLAQDNPGFHYLQNSIVELGGIPFVGTTLWFRHFDHIESMYHTMNDFSVIKDPVPRIYEENEEALTFLAENMSAESFVVTHYLPSQRSVSPRYLTSPLNCFFVCDIEDLIRERQPKYFVHGHTHDSAAYRIGETQVICNPFGYVRHETNPNFDENLVLDL